MNRILFLSDLHLGDMRNRPGRDDHLLGLIGTLIQQRDYAAVLNLGDTVSRAEFLRKDVDVPTLFRAYRRWRDALGIPFRECAIFRERPFFQEIFGQNEDSVWNTLPGTTVLTFSPYHENDHEATGNQWQWLSAQIKAAAGRTLIIGSHVPYPGCCSRPDTPGIYLPVPRDIQLQLETRDAPAFWAGGHFHWDAEPPVTHGSLTAFMGARFLIDAEPAKTTYLRELDLDSLQIATIMTE